MHQATGVAEPGARGAGSSTSGWKGAVTTTSHLKNYAWGDKVEWKMCPMEERRYGS